MTITHEQVTAYGVSWTITVYSNGIGARLRNKGRNVGYSLFYPSWLELIANLEPAPFVRVFVTQDNSIFLPR